MLINNKYEYAPIDRVTNDDGTRFYTDPLSGRPLPSITTILDASKDKTFLVEWEKRVGSKKAQQIRDEATGLGTLMHTHMECHIQNIERPRGNNLVRLMAHRMADTIIREGMPKVDEVWGIEVPLYYPDLFAGTSDLVGVWDGKPAIMDYKNTKKMKKREHIEDYFCQTAAYGLCSNKVYNTNIKTGVIFMVDRECNYNTFVIEGKEYEKYEIMFLERFEKYLSLSSNN